MIARLWSYLTLKNLAQPRPAPESLGAESEPTYAMWLERDRDRWDWLDANLYRQRGGPR